MPDTNSNKMMTKRVQSKDRLTVLLSYPAGEANALRRLAASITIKGDHKASLSLLSRRSLQLYAQLMAIPASREREIDALSQMVTPVPTKATHSKRATA